MIVASTWELSLDALDRRGVPQARPLLRLLSCYALATPIPLRLLAPECLVGLLATDERTEPSVVAADAERRLERGLAQLRMLGLIDVRSLGSGRHERALVVHPVVADTNRYHLFGDREGKVDVALVCRVAAELVGGALEHLDHEQATDWPAYRAYSPHLRALFGTVAIHLDREHLEQLVAATVSAARALNLSGTVRASERLLRAALNAVAGCADNDLIRLTVLHDLAWPMASLGRSAEAEAMYQEVLAARHAILGAEHPETLRTRHELAWVAAVRGRWAGAEKAYREVLDARRRILGSDHYDTLITHHELGWAIACQARGAEARPILLDVFYTRQRLLGDEHPRTLKTLHDLAWVTAIQGRWAEAEASYRALLERGRPVLGAEHPDLLTFRHELAWILAEQGDHAAAMREYRTVLDARRWTLGEHHPDTIATRRSLDRLRRGMVTPARHWA